MSPTHSLESNGELFFLIGREKNQNKVAQSVGISGVGRHTGVVSVRWRIRADYEALYKVSVLDFGHKYV